MTAQRLTPPAPVRLLRLTALAAVAGAACAFGQTTLVGDSPFAPAGTPAGTAAASAQAYELAGSSVEGKDVLVCIYDRQDKRSDWIPVGGSDGAVHVVSFDPERDRAVVTISGARKELTLRKASSASTTLTLADRPAVPVSAPQPPPAPVVAASAPSRPPEVLTNAAREQQEARMLVSDLLEIGVQQRKAYQEARQKAAQAAAQPSN